ncbi:MAG: type II toxin-antitoxin system VapC family toxin [Gemmatimonadetes bacterium]|nr:type II toxin-antitoxin system VapC family toxin [Gemmatimonadota bacterium]MYC93037.1 type II toxin-antitoxin system VapC family toxin [Gemmatimonadota bacterium]MYG36339.1 type II toxin-antitoxin system VapC family toxin [Gemmatimonadota bacterium]
MIALDTNVLVRYLVRDDEQQAESARALLESLTQERPGYACREVVVELVWVLERAYGVSRERIATILQELVATQSLVIEASEDVARAGFRYRTGGPGFSDLMILAAADRSGARPLNTFDRKAARTEGVELLQ